MNKTISVYLLLVSGLAFSGGLFAQKGKRVKSNSSSPTEQTDPVRTIVEHMPEFPGGEDRLAAHIAQNTRYPADAFEKGIQGKVYTTFTVDTDGKIIDAKTIRSVHRSPDKEALRVLKSMPEGNPAPKTESPAKSGSTSPLILNFPDKTQRCSRTCPTFNFQLSPTF